MAEQDPTLLPPASNPVDYEFRERPSSWPRVFGIIAIVFGAFGIISGGFAIFGALAMSVFKGFQTAAVSSTGGDPEGAKMVEAIYANMEKWSTVKLIMAIVMLLLAILLLTGGILLVMRKFAAPRLLTVWSYAKIVIGIGGAFVGMKMQSAQMQAMQEAMNEAMMKSSASGGTPVPSFPAGSFFSTFYGIVFFLQVVWICALPVVLLIWLHREIVKKDIATWRPVSTANAEG